MMNTYLLYVLDLLSVTLTEEIQLVFIKFLIQVSRKRQADTRSQTEEAVNESQRTHWATMGLSDTMKPLSTTTGTLFNTIHWSGQVKRGFNYYLRQVTSSRSLIR